MADYTSAQLLTVTLNAIYALTSGRVSSYSLNGRSYTMLNLKDLCASRDQLQNEAKAVDGSSQDFTLVAFGKET